MYLYLKALHIVFVVSWFAGLFYMVRLFIYHAEAASKPDDQRTVLQDQFKIMERRLWYIITWPAAVLATIFGCWMMIDMALWNQPWMVVKLVLTALLWAYHLINHKLFKQFQSNVISWSPNKLRVWNEIATLWLVAIVFVVVLKSTMNWVYGTLGFFLIGIALMLAIKMYKRLRQ